jgi:hypothetical protein
MKEIRIYSMFYFVHHAAISRFEIQWFLKFVNALHVGKAVA